MKSFDEKSSFNANFQEDEDRVVKKVVPSSAPIIHADGEGQGSKAENPLFQPVSLEFKGASLREVIRALSMENKVNFIIPDDLGSKKVYLKLQQVPWDKALEAVLETYALGMVKLRGNVLRIDTLAVLEGERKNVEEVQKRAVLMTPTKVLVLRLSYSKAEKVAKIVQSMLASAAFDKRVKVEADTRTNSLIVEAIPEELAKIRSVVDRIDLETPQVKIETRVIEVLKQIDRFMGINWGLPFRLDQGRGLGFGNLVFPNRILSAFSVDTGARSRDNGGRFDVHVGSLNNSIEIDARLRLAELSNLTRNLQNNSVLVLDRETANIEAGEEDYFQVPTGQGQSALSSVKYALALEVTPHITADGSVQMKVRIENSAPIDARKNASTSKSLRTLTTNLLRKSGETAVIGGLYTTVLRKSSQGLPYVSGIPIIGLLFQSHGKIEDKRELVIMVTPTIVTKAKRGQPGSSISSSAVDTQGKQTFNLDDEQQGDADANASRP